jgi:hypothetical protein
LTWVKLDDGFADHPKVLGLSDSAFRLYVTALCYSARYLTDGTVPSAFANNAVSLALDIERSPIRELLDVGLWLPSTSDPNDYEIHDFLEYNPSKGDVEHERERNAVRQRRFRERTHPATNAESNGHGNAVSAPVPYPTPTPKKKLLFEPLFEAFWTAYPRKSSKAGAKAKFQRLIEKGTDAAAVIAGAERYRDDPNREAEFTKLPTTWLSQGCWEDEPLPSRLPRGIEPAAPKPMTDADYRALLEKP